MGSAMADRRSLQTLMRDKREIMIEMKKWGGVRRE